jgi:hypothetical protein
VVVAVVVEAAAAAAELELDEVVQGLVEVGFLHHRCQV